MFISIVEFPKDPVSCEPVTFTFAFAVTVVAPIEPVNCEPVTATLTLVPPKEDIGDCDKAVIPNV